MKKTAGRTGPCKRDPLPGPALKDEILIISLLSYPARLKSVTERVEAERRIPTAIFLRLYLFRPRRCLPFRSNLIQTFDSGKPVMLSSKFRLVCVLVMCGSAFSVPGEVRCTEGAVESTPRYVGTSACRPCHEREYKAFTTFAKKSSSFQNINKLKKELAEEEMQGCYSCHTTGYGKPGGFVSEEATPHLKNAGCEVCHGPGEYHVRTRDPKDIHGRPTERDCKVCHTSETIKAFRYKPLIHGGAH